jgi:hypothetical protein
LKRTRHQKGYLYKKGNLWLLRFYDNQELPDGTITRVQKAHKLVEATGEYRTKAAARTLAEEFLTPLNDGRTTPQSVMSLARFVEGRYLPFVETHKRTSTFHGYRNVWKGYLQPHGGIALRDFRTADVEQILESIAQANDLTSTTLQHIKAFLWESFAMRSGRVLFTLKIRCAIPFCRRRGQRRTLTPIRWRTSRRCSTSCRSLRQRLLLRLRLRAHAKAN